MLTFKNIGPFPLNSAFGAYLVGCLIILSLGLLGLALHYWDILGYSAGVLLWGSWFLAAVITALLSGSIWPATVLNVPASLLLVLQNAVWAGLGEKTPYVGIKGAALIFGMGIAYGLVLCLAGAVVGGALAHWRQASLQPNQN